MVRTPVTREDDDKVQGYIAKDHGGWAGQTVFGYVFARSTNKDVVEAAVRDEGSQILAGMWQYYDRDDHSWYPCKLREIHENRVVVTRTNAMGYEDTDVYKYVEIINPNETNLIKS